MNSKEKGERSTGAIIGRFMKHGIPVMIPFSDNQRYDLVIEYNSGFRTVQCKTAHLGQNGAAVMFATCSIHFKTYKRTCYKGQIDYFAAYCAENDGVYLVPVDSVGSAECSLRLEAPKRRGRSDNIRWAKDFALV
jgi:hypothetical protein